MVLLVSSAGGGNFFEDVSLGFLTKISSMIGCKSMSFSKFRNLMLITGIPIYVPRSDVITGQIKQADFYLTSAHVCRSIIDFLLTTLASKYRIRTFFSSYIFSQSHYFYFILNFVIHSGFGVGVLGWAFGARFQFDGVCCVQLGLRVGALYINI